MFKSLMAMAALAGLMSFGASSAQARYGHAHHGQYAAGYGYGAAACPTACPVPCAAPCPRRTPCTSYQTGHYRDCLPRYVAGDCMMNTCKPVCGPVCR